jgi:hypothetical protein
LQLLWNEAVPKMSAKDVVVEIIPLEESRRTHASGSSTIAGEGSSTTHRDSPIANLGFFQRRSAYAELSGGEDEENAEKQEEAGKLEAFVHKITESLILRRLLLRYLPPALILSIGIAVTLAAAKTARIGDVHLVGLFVWLEVIWAIFWVAWGTAYSLPFAIQYLGGFLSSGIRYYTEILKAVLIPMTAFFWAMLSRAATPVLCLFDEDEPGKCDDQWVAVIRRALLAAVCCTGLYFIEKILIHLLTVNYRKRQFRTRLDEGKKVTQILILLYEASVKLYPGFCPRFATEDDEIHRSMTLTATRMGGVDKSRWRKTVSRFYSAEAMEETKSRLQGKEVLQTGSPRSVVLRALETAKASEALARRLWMSFTFESDVVTEDDISRILGPDRLEDALDIFHALDKDENGDISLEEMIQLVTKFSRDRHNIERSMHDIGQAVKSLDRILEITLLFFSGLIFGKLQTRHLSESSDSVS